MTTVADLRAGDVFDWVPPRWHGPSTVIENTRSGSEPTRFDFRGGLRRITFANDRVVNPPGLAYERDETPVTILARHTEVPVDIHV